MVILRLLLLAFNVAVVSYLVFQLLVVYKTRHPHRNWYIALGTLLLLAPVAVVVGAVKPAASYLFLYPVALAVLIYFIRSGR